MSSATQIRCHECHTFFPKSEAACPDCGTPRYAFCKALAMGKVNSHLYDMARSADREAKYARAHGLG